MRFFRDLKKYKNYVIYSARASLKSDISGSYLSWIWWILNPLCFMLIYSYVFGVLFRAREPSFGLFIFIGLTIWNFFSHNITRSVKVVRSNKAIIAKIYMPKYVLLLHDMAVEGFKMLISFGIVFVMMVIYRVPFTLKMLYVIPILITLMVVTYACGVFCLHLGVFIRDLPNAIPIILRLLMYLTGIFYDVQKRVPEPLNIWVMRINPLAMLIDALRNAFLNGEITHTFLLPVWFLLGVGFSALGTYIIYKNENNYVKVI